MVVVVGGGGVVVVGGGAGMLLSAYMRIFGYSPLKIQCTADRMNLKNWRLQPLASPLSTPLMTHSVLYKIMRYMYEQGGKTLSSVSHC